MAAGVAAAMAAAVALAMAMAAAATAAALAAAKVAALAAQWEVVRVLVTAAGGMGEGHILGTSSTRVACT